MSEPTADREEACSWVYNEDGPWEASCGSEFDFCEQDEDGPDENHFRFCPFCGRPLRVIAPPRDDGWHSWGRA